MTTKYAIRTKKTAPCRLVFEVLTSTETLLVRSARFVPIRKPKAGSSVLTSAARDSEMGVTKFHVNTVSLTPRWRRGRVILEGELHPDDRWGLLEGISEAFAVDERPQNERREDLSGLLCDLTD
ncbi:MAG: hypothetical protein WCG13_12385 [Burkholderiales bacterium]